MAISRTSKVLLILGGLLIVVLVVGIVAFALIAERMSRPSVESNSVLVLKVSGSLPDYVPDAPIARAFGIQQEMSFTSLVTQLRKAKVDNRIGAVLLDIDMPDIGWAKADELRDAVKDFRTSGKPAYAYMEIGMNRDYYIATSADKIFIPPPGDLYINGFAAEAMFYKGSLDKLGIDTDVIQFGPKYKNAPDQYTKKQMGDGQREVINDLINEYYGRMANAIVESRKKQPTDIDGIIDNAPYDADKAKELGLIDGASYRDQVYDELKNQLGYKQDDELRTIGGSQYREIPSDSLGLNKGERVAVIYASGAINTGHSSNSPLGGEIVGSDTIVRAVNDAAADKSIKAIVLRVDSPGGSALASDLMWKAIEDAKAKKPVVVSMADVAASGGYYISCNANKIVAEPSTVTGSIGLFLGKPVLRGFYDWLGISNEYVTKGKNAGIFKETEHWTDEERKKIYDSAHHIYFDQFVAKVAKGRNKTSDEVDAIGEGRVWTGTQAKSNGLIDEFGGLEKAIEVAKQLANLPEDREVRRVVFPAPRPFFETWFGSSDDDSADAQTQQAEAALAKNLPKETLKAIRYSQMFNRMSDGDAMLLMPFDLQIK